MQEVQRNHRKWLAENRHMKYLWIPYTDAVVVVKNNRVPEVRTNPFIASVRRHRRQRLGPVDCSPRKLDRLTPGKI